MVNWIRVAIVKRRKVMDSVRILNTDFTIGLGMSDKERIH